MTTLLMKEEEKHILEVLPILLKSDREFRSSVYTILSETFVTKEEAHITREDFSELKGIVRELAQAQKRTEIRVEELAVEVKGLAQAQKRTEIRVEELAVEVKELAQAQKRTEIRVEELVIAQKRTEDELRLLTKTVKDVQKELGGLSNTIGYDLEDKFMVVFPDVLKEDFGFENGSRLDRRYIEYPDGRDDEINIYGEGKMNGEGICLIGESKAQIGKGDVDKFIKLIDRAKGYLKKEILPIFLCYSIHPKVERYIKEKDSKIKVYKSSELVQRVR